MLHLAFSSTLVGGCTEYVSGHLAEGPLLLLFFVDHGCRMNRGSVFAHLAHVSITCKAMCVRVCHLVSNFLILPETVVCLILFHPCLSITGLTVGLVVFYVSFIRPVPHMYVCTKCV